LYTANLPQGPFIRAYYAPLERFNRVDRVARVGPMATAPSEPLSQRLAAIREQLKLLADYL
jgi:hypothetical protein